MKIMRYSLISIFVLFFCSASWAQLYQGPASGFIPGGAYQTTDGFTGYTIRHPNASWQIGHAIPFREMPPVPNPPNMKPPLGPPGSNQVDDQIVLPSKQPNLFHSFSGIPDDPNSAGVSFIPPDPICAAGPDHIMACTNTDFAIFDKEGNKLKEIDATLWFENVLKDLDPGLAEPFGVAFDPQIVYDHFADRWIMIYIAYDDVGYQSYLLVSTSDDSNPLGVWCNFAIPGNVNGSTFNTNLNDYPKLGVNEDAFYVTANMWDITTWIFQYVQVRIFEKSQFYSNTCDTIAWADFWDLRDPDNLSQTLNTQATVVPAVTFGVPGVEYLVNSSPYATATFMTLWTVWDPIGSPYMTAVNIPVTASEMPPDANQLGNGTPLIDVGGRRVRNAVYRDGNIWTAHSVADATGQFARARYVKIDVSGPTVLEDVSYGLANYWYYYPAITADASGNSIMVFSRSGLTEYAGIHYTGTVSGVPEPSSELKAGEANYVKTFGGSRNRWGDYNGIAVDPVDTTHVWMFAEYAASPANTWGTWWGEVSYEQVHPRNLYAFNGYHGAVPLAWDAPFGHSPLSTFPEIVETSEGIVTRLEHAHVQEDTAQTPSKEVEFASKQSLLSYNVYRSTMPGGPYGYVANVDRQYYRDETVINGTTYYYVVSAVYDAGESGYSGEDDGCPVAGGYYIHSGWAITPPVLDGVIDAGEWSSADVVDITYPGVSPSVTLYVMNDNGHLYLAVDDPGNATLDDDDQIGTYFDENHDREWPPLSPSGEGNFWVKWLLGAAQTEFRGIYGWWPGDMGFDSTVVPAPGVDKAISTASGHLQYEMDIDLAGSDLNAAPGDVVGYRTCALIQAGSIWSGSWPQEIAYCPWSDAWRLPALYGDLELMAYACGDCNGDGQITFADALYIKNYYYQTPPGSPPPMGQGDVNLDGKVTFADALYIKNYYYQTPPGSPPPCEPPKDAPFREKRMER